MRAGNQPIRSTYALKLRIFTDVASGAQAIREGLTELRKFLRERDTLVTWKLDRLGRSLPHLIEIVTALQQRQIGFRSLQEHIDTTTSGGKLVFHVFGALAEFERDLVQERTQAGLAAARARGKKGGRRRVMDAKKVAMAVALLQNPDTSVTEGSRTLRVSRATLYRYLPSRDRHAGHTLSPHPADASTKQKRQLIRAAKP